jgi:hypothetical protein
LRSPSPDPKRSPNFATSPAIDEVSPPIQATHTR